MEPGELRDSFEGGHPRIAPNGGESAEPSKEAGARRRIVYCVVPSELEDKLHELLRRHFRENPAVEVIVEQRWRDRRRQPDRRMAKSKPPATGERRLIKAEGGRRAGERRAPIATIEQPPLPRRAARFAANLTFFARTEPTAERSEDLDTARLITRFQGGERDTYFTLYSRYYDRIYAYLRLALSDSHEAEDVAQDVMVDVLQALPDYERRRQPFRAWLFTLVRNQAISRLRKLGRLEPMDPADIARERDRAESAEAELPVFDWITDRDLQVLMERLPLPQRQTLTLRFMLDLSHRQIAQVLGRSETDVRTLQHRALRFLEDRLTALGRAPSRTKRSGMRRTMEPANVLRARRFALM